VLAFGTGVTDEDRYAAEAAVGIRRVAPPGSLVLTRRGASVQATYNELLDEAASTDGVEGLVLVHQDVELHDPSFCAAVRRALALPDVAIVGVDGRRGAAGLAEPRSAQVGTMLYGGAFDEPPVPDDAPVDVEFVDGALMAFSPWAIRALRFDRRFEPYFHLYDRDICFQARAQGRRVVVVTTHVTHHFRRDALASREDFVEALSALHRKWAPA
jgi:GT2 family glycosyltransferase